MEKYTTDRVCCSSSSFEEDIKARIQTVNGGSDFTDEEIKEICRMFSIITNIANQLNYDLVLINKPECPSCA